MRGTETVVAAHGYETEIALVVNIAPSKGDAKHGVKRKGSGNVLK